MDVDAVEFDPKAPGFFADPYAVYRRLREREPVHWSRRLRAWVLTRASDADTFFMDPRLTIDKSFAARHEGPPNRSGMRALGTDGPGYMKLRSLVNKAFTPRVVQALRPRIAEIVDELLERASAHGGPVELISEFAFPMPLTVIAELLGVPASDHHVFRTWAYGVAVGMDHTLSRRSDGGSYTRMGDLGGYLMGVVAERRGEPRDDLISKLVAAEDEGDRLSDGEITSLCIGLLFAGHETTVNLVGNGMLGLLGAPDQLERMRDDPSVAKTGVEELLRWDAPAHIMSRVALEDIEIGGVAMARGEIVLGALGAMNRDPERFDEPERIELGRYPNPHLAFGQGSHFCWGAPLSRLEAQIALPALLKRFPRLRLLDRKPQWRNTLVLRGLTELNLAPA